MRNFLMASGLTVAAAFLITPALVPDALRASPETPKATANPMPSAQVATELASPRHVTGASTVLALGPLRDKPAPKPKDRADSATTQPQPKPPVVLSDLAPAAGVAESATPPSPWSSGRRNKELAAVPGTAVSRPLTQVAERNGASQRMADPGTAGDRARPRLAKAVALQVAKADPEPPKAPKAKVAKAEPKPKAQSKEMKAKAGSAAPNPNAGSRGGSIYIVIGSFLRADHAAEWVRKYKQWQPVTMEAVVEGRTRQRVVVGPFGDDEAKIALSMIKAGGVKDAWPLKSMKKAASATRTPERSG